MKKIIPGKAVNFTSTTVIKTDWGVYVQFTRHLHTRCCYSFSVTAPELIYTSAVLLELNHAGIESTAKYFS